MNDFYQFRCEANASSAELLIFAAIGDFEDMGEVSAKAFARDLAALPQSVRRIELHINSPGGSLFEASAIYSRLADHKSEKIVYIDGLAASAASIVAMVGHKVYIRANANIMIHLPQGISMGNSDDMRKMAAALDTVTESMMNVYVKKTSLPRDEIRAMLAAETWLTPDQAVEKRFADEVRGVVKAAASLGNGRVIFNGAEFNLSRFHNVPMFTTNTGGTMPDEPKPTDEPTPTPVPAPTPTPAPPEPEPKPAAVLAQKKDDDDDDDDEDDDKKAKSKKGAKAHFERGVQSERTRVLALQSLDRPSTHAIVTAAIKDGKQVADITAEVIAAMEKGNSQDARRRDAASLNGIPASSTDLPDGDRSNGFGALIKERVLARTKQRRLVSQSRN